MSLYLDRLTRVVPPRAVASLAGGGGSGAVRVVSATNANAVVQLDNDIFQPPAPGAGAATPGGFGRARVRFSSDLNNCFINFDTVNTVVANSAALSGNTRAMLVPSGGFLELELDPAVDKWMAYSTINGGALVAFLRYQIISVPTQGLPGSG